MKEKTTPQRLHDIAKQNREKLNAKKVTEVLRDINKEAYRAAKRGEFSLTHILPLSKYSVKLVYSVASFLQDNIGYVVYTESKLDSFIITLYW